MSCDLGEMTRRRPRSSPAAPPLEDDNLLSEILLRLPPDPSSLPRASVVSKRWLGLISDPGFSRRFRLHHRRNPPLLGFFLALEFIPTMEPPNRVSDGRFRLPVDEDEFHNHILTLGCRHGLVLMFQVTRLQVLVWDSVTGELHRIAAPPGFDAKKMPINGTVLRAAGDIQHFQVVLVETETNQQHTQAIARVYKSETGEWGNLMSTPLQSKAIQCRPVINMLCPGVLVGDSLYWLLSGSMADILEFDWDRQSLSVIHVPVDIYARGNYQFTVMRAEGGGLGFIYLSRLSAQLWTRKTDCDGAASWVLGRTFELDKLLSMNLKEKTHSPMILGFAEDNNVVLLSTIMGLFTIQLESLQFKKLGLTNYISRYYPLESVYAAGAGGEFIGHGNDGAGQMDVR